MNEVIAIIQARTGARRLPNKVLLKLKDKTVLEHVIARVQKAKAVSETVVATTIEPQDLKIVELVSRRGVRVLCGSQNDVLDRYYQAARLLKAAHVVRITADCPVMDPSVIDLVVSQYFKSKADYCSNAVSQTFPDGLDVEVFSFAALKKAWNNAKLTSQREHVTPYLRDHKRMFKVVSVEHSHDLGAHRWTLDETEDYEFLKKIFDGLYAKDPFFGMNDILRFLSSNPKFSGINADIARNLGYAKSLKEDRVAIHG